MQDIGSTPHFLHYLYSISFIFSIIISILFGLISVFGCFVGGGISGLLSNTYRFYSATNDNTEIKAARIGALTTLTMGTISAIVSILIAYIK
jgi:hypothetical protein